MIGFDWARLVSIPTPSLPLETRGRGLGLTRMCFTCMHSFPRDQAVIVRLGGYLTMPLVEDLMNAAIAWISGDWAPR
jgi:hypothetical protein